MVVTMTELDEMSKIGRFGASHQPSERITDRYHLVTYLPTASRLRNPKDPSSGEPTFSLVSVFSTERLEAKEDPFLAARSAYFLYREEHKKGTIPAGSGQATALSYFHTNSLFFETLHGPTVLHPGLWPRGEHASFSKDVVFGRCYSIPWRNDFVRLPTCLTEQGMILHTEVHELINSSRDPAEKLQLQKDAWAGDLHTSRGMLLRGLPP